MQELRAKGAEVATDLRLQLKDLQVGLRWYKLTPTRLIDMAKVIISTKLYPTQYVPEKFIAVSFVAFRALLLLCT